ncbi:MAG: hypothetical protein JWP12_2635 [Bacteroidetes bacterium]|nr:hypothetical protein [Bacteroidota bacterium]
MANDNGKAICTDGAGNCYTAADSSGFARIIKYDVSGNPGWNVIAWTGNATAIADHGGYLYVAGDSSHFIRIGKYDHTGNKLWQTNGSSGNVNGITLDNAGNIYTTGDSNPLSKYDASGNLLWNVLLPVTGNSIAVDTSGNLYITGYFAGTLSFGSYTLTALGSKDIFIAKYDATGNCLWAKRAGGSHPCCYSDDSGNAITTDNAGNSYITGSIVDTADFDSFTLIASSNDIFVAKYDVSGNALWVKQATGGSDQEGRCIALDNSGNILIGGSYVPNVDFGGFSMHGWGNYDAFIAKYDNNGNFITAIKAGGPTWNEYIYGICTDNSGNTFFTGSFSFTAYFGSDTLVSDGGYNVCTGKIDMQTGITEIAADLFNMTLYPNPANEQITFDLSEAINENTIIQIKNTLGQTIKTAQLSKGNKQLEMDIRDLAQGFYFIQLQNEGQLLSKKFIKQ